MITGRRHAALTALVAGGAAVALLTEVLSAFHALRPVPLAIAWSVALLAGVGMLRRRAREAGAPLVRMGVVDTTLALGIGAIAAVTAFTAWVSPPNSVDAFGYHLVRVVYWAQAGSVRFFPTHYFNQLSMPPLAEYAMLHTYVLSGGDRLVNLVQWVGFAGSILAVSLIAQALGAGRRGQMLAAVFCATLPNAILQASGAKNDCVLSLWLAAMVYFTLRRQAFWSGTALGLALLTKGTAWVFAPPLLVVSLYGAGVRDGVPRRRMLMLLAVCPLILNGPQWWRNLEFSGRITGPPSAQEDGRYRWTNERFGVRTTVSNALRHGSQQLAGRAPSWNRGVFAAVLAIDRRLGIDPDDPTTTWPGTRFSPPVNSNHEADAPNRWHFLLLLALLGASVARREWLVCALGIALAFAAFCAVLKYQPFAGRLLLPLFVLGAPLFGALVERLRPAILAAVLQAALCLILFDQTRHALFENWTRPLRGPASILRTPRNANYFRDMQQFEVRAADYERTAQLLADAPCGEAGIDNEMFQLEYPLMVLLRQRNPRAHFSHSGVANASVRYAVPGQAQPCAVVCLGCASVARKQQQYQALGEPVRAGHFLVYGTPPPR